MEQQWGLLLGTLLLGLGVLLVQWSSSASSKRLRLPPGPRPLPVLGNLLLVAASKCMHKDFHKLAKTYGPIMWLRLGTKGTVVVQSTELAMEVLKHQDSTQAATVGGYHIPANTTVIVNVWALGRDPASWKNPDQFRPQRFLLHEPDARSEVDLRGHHFQLLPFGSGKRICPGIGLGLTMLHLTLATVLHSFTWSLPVDVKPQDLDMSEQRGLVARRAFSLKAVPHPKVLV